MAHKFRWTRFSAILLLASCSVFAQTAQPIRVAIVGLVHNHVIGLFHDLSSHPEITLVGVSEPDAALRQAYIDHTEQAPPLATPHDSSLNYLAAVLTGTLKLQHDQTSLDTNVTVVRILDAARRSAETGRTIRLADEAETKK